MQSSAHPTLFARGILCDRSALLSAPFCVAIATFLGPSHHHWTSARKNDGEKRRNMNYPCAIKMPSNDRLSGVRTPAVEKEGCAERIAPIGTLSQNGYGEDMETHKRSMGTPDVTKKEKIFPRCTPASLRACTTCEKPKKKKNRNP